MPSHYLFVQLWTLSSWICFSPSFISQMGSAALLGVLLASARHVQPTHVRRIGVSPTTVFLLVHGFLDGIIHAAKRGWLEHKYCILRATCRGWLGFDSLCSHGVTIVQLFYHITETCTSVLCFIPNYRPFLPTQPYYSWYSSEHCTLEFVCPLWRP